MKTHSSTAKEQPLKNSMESAESQNPGLMDELEKARQRYENAQGADKEKAKADFQRLSDEKKRMTGDANPPARKP